MAHPLVFKLGTVWDLYPHLTAIESINEAKKDGLISEEEHKNLVEFYKPYIPEEEPKKPEKIFTSTELRSTICPWSGKRFADMESDEIDSNVDAYSDELKEKALAYLRMRGYS